MAQRFRTSLLFAAALMAAAAAQAAKVGHIALHKTGHGTYLQVETDGLTAPKLSSVGQKIVIVIPGGQRDQMKTIKVGAGALTQIRFGMDGTDLHVVLDLGLPEKGTIDGLDAQGFKVLLAGTGPAAAAAESGNGSAAGSSPAPAAGAPAPAAPAAASSAADQGSATGAVDALNPSQAGYTYRLVDLSLGGDDKHSELILSADGPASYKASVRDNGRLLSLLFRNSSLAWSGDAAKLKDESIESVSVKQSLNAGESEVRVEIRLTDKLDYAFKRDQNQLVVRLDRPAHSEEASSTGDMSTPVSLDVQNADLVGVLKSLCEQAGFDYQFSKDLLAKTPPDSLVTVKVENRPFREVLDTLLTQAGARQLRQGNTLFMGATADVILRRNHLPVITRTYKPKYLSFKQISDYLTAHYTYDDDQKGRIKSITTDPLDTSAMMLVGSEDEVAEWLDLIKHVDVPETGEEGAGDDDSGGGGQKRTQVFHLQYLDSTNSGLINGSIAQLYPEGENPPTPLIDSPTRTMVVTTQLKYLRKIQKLLDRIDIKPQQVNIEGKIVEVDQGVSQQLGINWNANSQNSQINDPTTGLPDPVALGSFNTGLSGNFTSQLQLATIVGSTNILGTIQAMVDTNKADIVSAPNITTADNLPATISTTDVQVYTNTTTTISNGVVTTAQTYTTSNIPLTLVVTPKISQSDHRILMNINFQLTTANGSALAAGAPLPTSQQSAITNASVNSGDTAVIGGLVRQNNTEETRQVPVLGDIPLLGLLFRFNTIVKSKKEVIIFITPTIVED